jgi:hypothetical protein
VSERRGLRERRATRRAGSDRRAGAFPKANASALILRFTRGHALALAVAAVSSAVCVVPASLLMPRVLRPYFVGAGLASGFWIVWVIIITFSGAAQQTAGATAEEWTAQELRRWSPGRVINGLLLHSDIDHVAVGPARVLVVETKWSAGGWSQDRWTAQRRREALEQLERETTEVQRELKRTMGDVPLRAVLVLWPSAGPEVPSRVDGARHDTGSCRPTTCAAGSTR